MSEKQPVDVVQSLPIGVDQSMEQNGSDTATSDSQVLERRWLPGSVRRLPWLSIGALVIILLVNAAILILYELIKTGWKGHDLARAWKVEPSVLLAIFVWINNKALAAIFGQATIISWWTAAMDGRTLAQLHHSWEATRSVVAIVKKFKLFNWLCVASIAYTLFSLHGTLLQKSISVNAYYDTEDTTITAVISQEFPRGASGNITGTGSGDSYDVTIASGHLRNITDDYANDVPFQMKDFTGCKAQVEKKNKDPEAQCEMKFPGIGFKYNCSYADSTLLDPSANGSQLVFTIGAGGWTPTSFWSLFFSATFKNETGCDSEIYSFSCTMTPAIVNYPVFYDQNSNTWSLLPPRYDVDTDIQNLNFTASGTDSLYVDQVNTILPEPSDEASLNVPGGNTTLGGFSRTFSNMLAGSAQINFEQENNLGYQGAFTGAYITAYNQTDACRITFKNPVQDIVNEIRNFMFLTAVEYPFYDELTELTAAVDATITQSRAYYDVYRWYLLGGMLLEGLCILVILTLFKGYHRLGRAFTLSPLEIGKAMQNVTDAGVEEGRMFMPANGVHGTNMPADELLDMIGEQRVQYGEVAPQRLGLALSQVVKKPENGNPYV